MSIEDKIKHLMERGWNLNIECKGKGRVYEMTYEVTAYKVPSKDSTMEEKIKSFYPKYAIGNNLENVIDDLAKEINKSELD